MIREALFVLGLLASASALTFGVAQLSAPAAWIVGGICGGGLSWLVRGQ